MSTDLYRVRVLALHPEHAKATFRVFLTFYGLKGVPTDTSFFLRLLRDDPKGALASKITGEQLLDAADMIRVALAGSLRGVSLKTWHGEVQRLEQIRYGDRPAGAVDLELCEEGTHLLERYRDAGVENVMALGGDVPDDPTLIDSEFSHASDLVNLVREAEIGRAHV